MDIQIRAANPPEYDELGEITAQAYIQDGLLAFGESDWYLGELRDVGKRAAAAEVLAAVQDGVLLGTVTYVPSTGGAMAELSRPGESEIRMLAVAPEARGRGAGQALVQACVDRARAAGDSGMVLSTQPVMRAAHRIYERLGFVRAPHRDWQPIPGEEFTLLTYELTL
ncbi:GNAT family N-acetyltransferase [Streptomyces sp. GKU 895]|nr:GNAT family N-acetyltransferase [Streptomyces sp. GKU 895]